MQCNAGMWGETERQLKTGPHETHEVNTPQVGQLGCVITNADCTMQAALASLVMMCACNA